MPHATTQVIATLSAALRRNGSVLASASSRAGNGEVRAIHRVRVATRRLREALPAAAGATNGDAERLTRQLRRVTKGLGFVRELDVSRDVLREFAEREAWPAVVVQRVDKYCQRQRDHGLRDVAEILDDLDGRAVRRDLQALAKSLEGVSESAGWADVAAQVRERARKLVEEIQGAGTVYAAEPLHRVRVATKKLRYGVEVAGEAVPGMLRRLKRLQAALGRLHDAQVLQRRIQELAAATKNRGVVASLSAMDESIEAACRQMHAGILKSLPTVEQLATGVIGDVPRTIGPKRLGRPARMKQADGRRRERVA